MFSLDSEFAAGFQHIQSVYIKTANHLQVLLTKQPIGCKQFAVMHELRKNTVLISQSYWSYFPFYIIILKN